MVKLEGASQHRFFKPACGAVLTALCGLALWKMPLGERWVNASYDYAFRFGARSVTNKVVLILMDNNAHNELRQTRGQWDRKLHISLLNKLAADKCPLVIFDVFFRTNSQPGIDQPFATLMRAHSKVVLMATQAEVKHSDILGATPVLPANVFLKASATNGVAWFDPDLEVTVT